MMIEMKNYLPLLFCLLCSPLYAQDTPTEADYYPITRFEIPEGVVLEASGFQMMPDGKMAVCSRRGEIWMISDPFKKEVTADQFKRFAHGLHETLTLAERDGWLYTTQRSDVSRLRDTDGDGEADEFEVVNDGWEISGDYHEYAFGSKFDKNGDIWVVLCLTGSFSSKVPVPRVVRASDVQRRTHSHNQRCSLARRDRSKSSRGHVLHRQSGAMGMELVL